MQASFKTKRNGAVAMQLDPEAAKAVFASVVFAARFHEGIVPLITVAERGLSEQESRVKEGKLSCR